MEKMQPKTKKIKLREPKDDQDVEQVEQPTAENRDVAKEMLAHMDMLLLKKRVDALERADARRDGPVGHVLKATPIIFQMMERLQEDIGTLRKDLQDQKDTARFITYFCRDIVRHMQDSAEGLPPHFVAPCIE